MSSIANTPKPPYYAVIFSSVRSNGSSQQQGDYEKMARRMEELATEQPGFLGVEAAREEVGITVSYWDSLEAIKNWKANGEHLQAQQNGRHSWYSDFTVRISKVERDYQL